MHGKNMKLNTQFFTNYHTATLRLCTYQTS